MGLRRSSPLRPKDGAAKRDSERSPNPPGAHAAALLERRPPQRAMVAPCVAPDRGFPRPPIPAVNLTALPRRFIGICRRRSGVAATRSGMSGGSDRTTPVPSPSANDRPPPQSPTEARGRIGSRFSLPDSIFEKSRMSLMTATTSLRTASSRSAYRAARDQRRCEESSVMPMIPFIGVRTRGSCWRGIRSWPGWRLRRPLWLAASLSRPCFSAVISIRVPSIIGG